MIVFLRKNIMSCIDNKKGEKYMFLRELAKKGIITINYYKDGLTQTCKGHVCNLNINQQTLSLKGENQQVYSIHFSQIKEIC